MKDPAMNLLDPRFNYVPAVSTDISATWRRFGFDPRANQERRARMSKTISDVTAGRRPEMAPIRALVIVKA